MASAPRYVDYDKTTIVSAIGTTVEVRLNDQHEAVTYQVVSPQVYCVGKRFVLVYRDWTEPVEGAPTAEMWREYLAFDTDDQTIVGLPYGRLIPTRSGMALPAAMHVARIHDHYEGSNALAS